MAYLITVVKAGPPGERLETLRQDDSFICPECRAKVQIKMCTGIQGTQYPDFLLVCPNCNQRYGIART